MMNTLRPVIYALIASLAFNFAILWLIKLLTHGSMWSGLIALPIQFYMAWVFGHVARKW